MGEASQLWALFEALLRDIWHQYGPFAALLIIFNILYEWRLSRLWDARLKDKDKEIERLVADRNRLENIVLSKRLTSGKK